jgi:hypothetical protein
MGGDTRFFLEDPKVLFAPDKLLEFFPSRTMSLAEQANATARFAIVSGILVSLYYNSNVGLQGAFVAVSLIIVFWKMKHIETLVDTTMKIGSLADGILQPGPVAHMGDPVATDVIATNYPCRAPTRDNPFMNPTDDDTLPPCQGPGVDRLAERIMNEETFTSDPMDLYGTTAMQRNFHTVPKEDRGAFANWLFKDVENCKIEPTHCTEQRDLRRREAEDF